MKKWLFLAAAVAAVAILSHRPNPARDVARLEPVQAVYVCQKGESLCIETDTGAMGCGDTLAEAASDLKTGASGEIFLDTAEFLLLAPDVSLTREFHTLLRPTCRVAWTAAQPDLQASAAYLSIHPPKQILAQLRPEITQR